MKYTYITGMYVSIFFLIIITVIYICLTCTNKEFTASVQEPFSIKINVTHFPKKVLFSGLSKDLLT